jgi:hypothetical protein
MEGGSRMIDTDKYEGHTRGPWEFKHINSNWYQCDKIGEMHMEDIAIEEASVNAQLIADAPLLLEAYKRLRLVADELYLHIVGEPHMTLDELVAEMPWRNEE